MPETAIPSPGSYEFIIEPHRRALMKLELELGFFLLDVGQINVFSVTSRTKSYQRASNKAAQLKVPITDLDDLVGLRVVVGTLSEVPIVERFFTRQAYGKDIRILKQQKIERQSGYRATHLVVEKTSSYHSSVFPGRVEVQIHTIFEHAFNFLSRNWQYKQPWQTTPQWDKSFAELSRLLSKLDAVAEELHVQLTGFQTSSDSDALSPYALQNIIKEEFSEDQSIDNCVDACRMYVDLGYTTNGLLRVGVSAFLCVRRLRVYPRRCALVGNARPFKAARALSTVARNWVGKPGFIVRSAPWQSAPRTEWQTGSSLPSNAAQRAPSRP
jgi:ppGpp synthetase/RelA/SpoT-type nucleotidyltranferase